jgi:hypothetical protein
VEWLLWAGLLLVIVGWPLLFVLGSVVRRRVMGAPNEEYGLKDHAETQAWHDARDVGRGGRGW